MNREIALGLSLIFTLGGLLFLVAGGAGAITRAEAQDAATQPAYPLWNGKETPTQYAKRAKIKLVEQNLDLGKGVFLKVTLIPAGKFQMGVTPEEAAMAKALMHNGAGNPADETPPHEVTISRPFYMGMAPVTQEQLLSLNLPDIPKVPARDKGPHNPEQVLNWNDANDFCKTLAQKTGLTIRLPTEAEWEYACRAGTTTPFNTGVTISTDQANYLGDAVWGAGKKGVNRNRVMPVGSFKPNAWGLFDMHGNVPRWCSDWYGADYYANSPAVDPTGPDSGTRRVVRGGSWATPPQHCRSAKRDCVPENTVGIGLRLVVELKSAN